MLFAQLLPAHIAPMVKLQLIQMREAHHAADLRATLAAAASEFDVTVVSPEPDFCAFMNTGTTNDFQ